MVQLFIDGTPVPFPVLALHHTLRFVTLPVGQGVAPVLYTDGKRETRQWSLKLDHSEPKDPHGRSA